MQRHSSKLVARRTCASSCCAPPPLSWFRGAPPASGGRLRCGPARRGREVSRQVWVEPGRQEANELDALRVRQSAWAWLAKRIPACVAARPPEPGARKQPQSSSSQSPAQRRQAGRAGPHLDLLLGLVALKPLLQRAVGLVRPARVPPQLRQGAQRLRQLREPLAQHAGRVPDVAARHNLRGAEGVRRAGCRLARMRRQRRAAEPSTAAQQPPLPGAATLCPTSSQPPQPCPPSR